MVLPFALLGGRYATPAAAARSSGGRSSHLVGVAAVSFAVFGGGILHMTRTLQSVQDQGDWQSLPGFLSLTLPTCT